MLQKKSTSLVRRVQGTWLHGTGGSEPGLEGGEGAFGGQSTESSGGPSGAARGSAWLEWRPGRCLWGLGRDRTPESAHGDWRSTQGLRLFPPAGEPPKSHRRRQSPGRGNQRQSTRREAPHGPGGRRDSAKGRSSGPGIWGRMFPCQEGHPPGSLQQGLSWVENILRAMLLTERAASSARRLAAKMPNPRLQPPSATPSSHDLGECHDLWPQIPNL